MYAWRPWSVVLLTICACQYKYTSAFDPNRFDGDPLLREFLQPNHITNGEYDGLTTQEAEARRICTRPCDGSTPMICYYHFTMEHYHTVGPACANCTTGTPSDCQRKQCVTADGFERQVLTINRQIPGPSIQVCLYDTIVVDVKNKMSGKTLTLHWHGLYQRYTPYMDGVPFVTQCPILHNTKFRYKMPAVPDGTFFYHSHIAVQKMDGLEGSLIIREPRSIDKTASLWDFDLPSHAIIVTDWLHGMTDERIPGFLRTPGKIGTLPDTYLINGKNNYNGNGTSLNVPYHQFNVTRGSRYRFRIIAGSCLSCPYVISVEQHQMLLIATDGTYAEPSLYDSITMVAGDRMDVVINATVGNNGDSFWINVRAVCDGVNNTERHGEAILHYADSNNLNAQAVPLSARPDGDTPRGKSLNAGDASNCNGADDALVCMSFVNALEVPVNPVVLKPVPDFRLPVSIGFHSFDENSLFWNDRDEYHKWEIPVAGLLSSAMLNNRTFEHPPFPLLTQDDQIPTEMVCPDTCIDTPNTAPQCECVHILKFPLGSVGEILFVDQLTPFGTLYHPMHVHGNDMHIIRQGKIPANYTGNLNDFITELSAEMDVLGPQLLTVKQRPVVKDTIGNIPNGYTVARVHFNNPGFWFVHCHFIMHTMVGMDLVLQIGEKSEMHNAPAFFPRCNNYLPAVSANEFDEFMQVERIKRNLGLDNQ